MPSGAVKQTSARQPSGSGAWSPLSLPGLKGWYDASDAGSITSSSGAVSQWNDKSGLGRHLTQATGGSQPLTGAYTKNGLNVIEFGYSKRLNASTASHWTFMHDGTEYFVALVAYVVEQSPRKDFAYFGTVVDNASFNTGTYFRHNTEFLANPQFFTLSRAAFADVLSAGTSQLAAYKDTWNVLSGLLDPDNGTAANRAKVARNAGSLEGANGSTGAPDTGAPSLPLYVGQGTTTQQFRLGELVIATGNDTDRAAAVSYLMTKWGI